MQIGVIMGGMSSEREISLLTGNEILGNLDQYKYEVLPVPINSQYELIDRVRGVGFAFIALHGKFGEDGRIQAILESMGVPFSGSGVLASALCMDKNISKKLFIAENIRTPKWIMTKDGNGIDYDDIEKLGYPLVVKPNNGGSSIGTVIVSSRDEFEEAVKKAFKYDDEIMVEEYIKGEEITCCVLNGSILPIISITPKSCFFDYCSKYDDGGAEEKIIELPIKIKNKVEKIAFKCWNSFKLKAYARIDMIIMNEEVYVLEINTLPGMTKNSLFPKSAAACGTNFSELLDKIIESSL